MQKKITRAITLAITSINKEIVKYFLVFIGNLLISVGLEPVLIHKKKICLASYYIEFSTNIKCTSGFSLAHFISAESCL